MRTHHHWLLGPCSELAARGVPRRGQAELSLTLPGGFEFSCGEGNHLTLPVWNSTTNELVSGCTARGELSAHVSPGVEQVGVAAGGPTCPRTGPLPPGGSSGWVEVGQLMDTLNFVSWSLPRGVHPINRTSNFSVEVAVGLYPIVNFQYSSTTLYRVSYHIQ